MKLNALILILLFTAVPVSASGWAASGGASIAGSGAGAAQESAAKLDELIYRAREAAAADRHAEAIALFEKACRLDSSLAHRLGKEIGLQYTWDDRAGEALPYFEAYIARNPDDYEGLLAYALALSWADRHEESVRCYRNIQDRYPRSLEARIGEARVVSWMDRNGEAELLYRKVLESDPGNIEARLGLAQVVNWRGRHREARELYREILADCPSSRDALLGLAQAEIWIGRPDRARDLLGESEGDPEAVKLLAGIDREAASRLWFDYGISEDSDELVMHRFEGGGTYYADDLTAIGLFVERLSMRQDDRPHIVVKSVSLRFYRRFDEDLSLNVDLEPRRTDYFDPFTFDTWLTWTPAWRLRFDLGAYSQLVETPLSVMREITTQGGSASADVRASDRILVNGLFDYRGYSDGNHRVLWGTSLSWLALKKPLELSIVPGYMGLCFSRWEDNGYYSPEEYHNIGLAAKIRYRAWERARFTIEGRVSEEKEGGGDFFTVGSFRAVAEYEANERFTLGGEFFTSNSSIAGEAGYGRTLGRVFLGVRL
jgi:tetratricopeptide (TPR) repeat protein